MDVDTYIAKLDDPQAAIVSKLRQIILMTAPGARESFKWSQPVYESDGPFAYIRAYSNHVDLGFWRGIDIRDPKAMLMGKGEKMRHIKISNTSEIDAAAISEFVVQAIQLNRVLGNPIPGRSIK